MNRFKPARLWLLIGLSYVCSLSAFAHGDKLPDHASATYLGNEGVLISSSAGKALFDPFFHNNYGTYQLVPEETRKAIFDGVAPYDNVSLIVVSHAHGDHFSAEDSLKYLQNNTAATLVAPKQAIAKLEALEGSESLAPRLIAIELMVGDPPKRQTIGGIEIESVRIPHAGWPDRKDVSNLVHRVSFGSKFSVIHMGDADPNDVHFKPYKEHWDERENNLAFPPYWFFTSRQGPKILSDRLKAGHSIGVHVPVMVPSDLSNSGRDYFSKPGELRDISHQH